MTIRSLFDPSKDIYRTIEKVITYGASQEARLKAEISEYVVTDSIEEQFRKLLDRMQLAMESGGENEIGVWVSGFYGSGKSSFTKYLGLAFDDQRTIDGTPFLKHLQDRLHKPQTKALLSTVAQRFPAAVVMLDLASEMLAGATMEDVSTATAAAPPAVAKEELKEQHFTILYGDTGYSYESIMGAYLKGAKAVVIEDPYIRLQHQIQNFVRFCETVLKAGTIKKISLITGHDDKTPLAEMAEKLEELKQSLLEQDVELDVKLNPNIHDREIRLDNGWVIKIGRGLDFYQKPGSWFEVGAHDLNLRKCLETKVDIFRA